MSMGYEPGDADLSPLAHSLLIAKSRRIWLNFFAYRCKTGRKDHGMKRYLLACCLVILMTLCVLVGQAPAARAAGPVTTPLRQSGLTPLWQENFTNGSVDLLQYTWAKGDNTALRSFVAPGFVYLGKDGSTIQIEQQINHFKDQVGEPVARTIEFDVFSPTTGSGRVSLRPRRRGDMLHLKLANTSSGATQANFAFTDGPATTVKYQEKTGPTYGWAHVVVSREQVMNGSILYTHEVVAINEEVREFTGPSGLTMPDYETYWATTASADGWSIEHNSTLPVYGKYIANVAGYTEFLSLADMRARLSGRANAYRITLPDPRMYAGPTKVFQLDQPLRHPGPHAIIYSVPTDPLTSAFDGSLSSGWNQITLYTWTFGDGTSGSGRSVNHTYSQPGTYQVTLTVKTKDGTATRTTSIVAN
jgi:hypothetical protein